MEKYSKYRSTINNHTMWEIGDVNSINSWDDCWVEKGLKLINVLLKIAYIQDNSFLSSLVDNQRDWS